MKRQEPIVAATTSAKAVPASFQSQVRELYDRDIRPLVHDRW